MRVALASLIAFVGLVAFVEASRVPLSERPGHFYHQRRRLGHMNDKPLLDLYKTYATAFVLPRNPDRSDDDFRNYLPSADECVNFLLRFTDNAYELDNIEQFVVLDSCLGYLYTSEHHQEDRDVSSFVDDNLDSFINDQTLKSIWEGTKIESFDEDVKLCFGDLLLQSIRAKKQYPDVICNNHYIQLLLDFAECQAKHPVMLETIAKEDSYGKIIYDLVHKRGERCFANEVRLINEAVRQHRANSPLSRLENKMMSWRRLKKQQSERMWPTVIVRLLSAVEGTKPHQEINLREINALMRGVITKDEKLANILLDHISEYATANTNLKSKSANAEDPDGHVRYENLINNMCAFVRTSDDERNYDFFTAFYRMIRMIKYEALFGISDERFINDVLIRGSEVVPMYLSVCSCNVLTFTQGTIAFTTENGPKKYKVTWKRDTSQMVQWPDAGYY